ncbi:MAG: 23S rRNA (pseudouridine(1915)-N(3))-methyltransferase RlmH [Alphaproteobacteria bacterium]|nr:23S rRNA (pseudouridine(1915)-N(3))-methyltransferase RlmH [Alphaproteobacteria bacterium]MBU2082560.1 23S rRNA (pseudouridine(1915)-N(3))-methyltransferase RlmH [Alphaproteobacteria bacterium]MBU2142800.1 23S rRNA (pseudouridine(1915)-N(3))-methyltransferase RlmH [Alphaproteobacteria bacterium]MBU2195222.1 23S rRNA (pseudouridine(1915)-N(3))-methyltransferase RlmH [Alphaproteobacteria bacterium]
MRLTLLSVGRLKSGAERDLFDEYVKRALPVARSLGFRGLEEVEVASGGGLDAEAERILAKIPAGASVIRLDEFGRNLTSQDFATQLGRLRDQGVPDLVFLIGGAEGYGDAVRRAVPDIMAFGAQTWPHRLVKAMLAEQVYRAMSIMAGMPYHKA